MSLVTLGQPVSSQKASVERAQAAGSTDVRQRQNESLGSVRSCVASSRAFTLLPREESDCRLDADCVPYHSAVGDSGAGHTDLGICPRRTQIRVKVDGIAVGVTKLCVALAPERIPRLLMRLSTRVDGLRVELVDGGGTLAAKGDSGAGLTSTTLPDRIERLYGFLGVEHETDAAFERSFRVTMLRDLRTLWKWRTEQAIEDYRSLEVAHHDAKRIQLPSRHPYQPTCECRKAHEAPSLSTRSR